MSPDFKEGQKNFFCSRCIAGGANKSVHELMVIEDFVNYLATPSGIKYDLHLQRGNDISFDTIIYSVFLAFPTLLKLLNSLLREMPALLNTRLTLPMNKLKSPLFLKNCKTNTLRSATRW